MPDNKTQLFEPAALDIKLYDLDTAEGAVIETPEVLAITGQPLATQHDPSLPAVAPGLYNRFYNSRYQAEPINRSRAKYLPITLSDETLYDPIAIINVANCDNAWIELDIEDAGGADFQVVPADQSVIRHDPIGIAGTKIVYKYQPVTGRLDADGKAWVELPDEFADKPLQIIINLPQDWSQIWMNLFAGLQLLGGATTLSVACAMEVGTMGVSTLVSLALVAWSADQMYAGANTLLTQQQTGTQAAALFEWAGMPPEYSELAAGILPVSTAMVKGVATSVVNNQAIRSVTIHAVRHGDKLVNRSITFIGQKIKHRYVFRRKAGQQPDVANTLEGAEGAKNLQTASRLDFAPDAGYLGGTLYPENKLRQLVSYLERRNVSVYGTVGKQNPGFQAYASGGGQMQLPANPTILQVKHELSHYLDAKKYGFDKYYHHMSRVEREALVLEHLKGNRSWRDGVINSAEKDASIKYVEKLRLKYE